jgi:hypothetical protein
MNRNFDRRTRGVCCELEWGLIDIERIVALVLPAAVIEMLFEVSFLEKDTDCRKWDSEIRGSFEVISQPGAGTKVFASVPE